MEIITGISVFVGLSIFFVLQAKKNKQFQEKILSHLQQNNEASLPELVVALGMKDGFYNRGKVMNAMNLLVIDKRVIQFEPEGTTVKNRLDVLRFKLA